MKDAGPEMVTGYMISCRVFPLTTFQSCPNHLCLLSIEAVAGGALWMEMRDEGCVWQGRDGQGDGASLDARLVRVDRTSTLSC